MSANLNHEVRQVLLASLTFSDTRSQAERRQHFDKAAMKDLAQSIKEHGVVQPILVRPWTDEHMRGIEYEVVAGERRAMAAKVAGLTEITATVRELTDEQVLELQLIENLQRQDLHELAEAEGYESLLKLGRTVEDIVAKVGKSRGTVYARMKLLTLIPEARKAFYEGTLAASTALFIARIPAALQKEALKDITTPVGYQEKAPMSVRQAQKHIHDNYMLRLSDAGFKTSDTTLVPAAGACGACPKRTGNQPELFGDVKGADVCTDPSCFKQKIAAHAERVLAEAKASGQKVIAGKDAQKAAPRGADAHLDGYVRLDERDYSRDKGTYGQALGKDYVPTLLVDPDSGKVVKVAPRADVEKKAKAGGSENTYSAQQRAQERKHRLAVAYRVALFKAVRAGTPKRKNLVRSELELVAQRMLDRLDHDATKRLSAACGWAPKKRTGQYSSGFDYEPPTKIPAMSDEDLVGLIRDFALAHELQVWNNAGPQTPKDMEAAAKREDVNAAAIKREIDQAAAAKAAKKPKAKAAKKKAKKA